MKRRSGILLLILFALTAIVAWWANEPNPYNRLAMRATEDSPYYWGYPLFVFGVGTLVVALLHLKSPKAQFVGAVSSLALCVAAFGISVMSVMHAPPVHTVATILIFFSVSLALLFLSGFTLGVWKSKRDGHDNAS